MLPFLTTDVKRYAQQVALQVGSDRIGPGNAVAAMGDLLAHYLRTSRVVLTTSGTTALQLALQAVYMRQKKRGIAIVPAYGFVATANAAALEGYEVRFADVDAQGCMTPETLGDALSSYDDVAVVLFVNFAGHTPEYMPKLRSLCEDYGALLIEDAACAIGHHTLGKYAGTFGHFGTLSFAPTKLVTTGQGGAVICEDANDYHYLCEYTNQGDSKRTGTVKMIGGNYRMSDLQAALGVPQLRRLGEILDYRYLQLRHFGNSSLLIRASSGPVLYNLIRVPPQHAKKALRTLLDHNVHAVMQYKTLYESPAFAAGAQDRTFPGAEAWKNTAIFLSHGLGLREMDCAHIAEAVRSVERFAV